MSLAAWSYIPLLSGYPGLVLRALYSQVPHIISRTVRDAVQTHAWCPHVVFSLPMNHWLQRQAV